MNRKWKIAGIIGGILLFSGMGYETVHAQTLTGKQAQQEIDTFISTARQDKSGVVDFLAVNAQQKKGGSKESSKDRGTIKYAGDNTENIHGYTQQDGKVMEMNVFTNGHDVFAQQPNQRFVPNNDALDEVHKLYDNYKINSLQLQMLDALKKYATVNRHGNTETITVRLTKKNNAAIQKIMWAGMEKGKTKQLIIKYTVDVHTHQPLTCYWKTQNYETKGDMANTMTWTTAHDKFSNQNKQGSIPMPAADQIDSNDQSSN